jgi:putrescine aminotransferase
MTLIGQRKGEDRHPVVAKYARHVNPAFVEMLGVFGYGRVFARALDVWVWDDGGRRYLDLLAGFGSVNIGHNHPRLVARLREHLAGEPLNLCHTGPSPAAADLAEAIADRVARPLEVSLFSNSGSEAVEGAMKLARAATGRRDFVSCEGGFHGTNPGALSVMGAERLRAPFEPLIAGCARVPFGEIAPLERALAGKTVAAFVVEPILAEGGVVLPPPGYLAAARELCRRYGTLFVLDEVQTGLGRTGSLFAHEAEGLVPDVLVLAKSLSGSIAPIGATVTTQAIFKRAYGSTERFDLHSSTFGGNAFSCVAALETLRILDDEGLAANGAARGGELLAGLRARLAGHPLVRDVRGRGLLVGIELGPTDAGWANALAPSVVASVSKAVFGQWAALKLLERGVICQPASQRWDVLRIEPPLTIRAAEVEHAVDAVAGVLGEYEGVPALLRDVAARLGRQFARGWTFE